VSTHDNATKLPLREELSKQINEWLATAKGFKDKAMSIYDEKKEFTSQFTHFDSMAIGIESVAYHVRDILREDATSQSEREPEACRRHTKEPCCVSDENPSGD